MKPHAEAGLRLSIVAALSATTIGLASAAWGQTTEPSIAYLLRVDSAHVENVEVAMRIEHAPNELRLAMKVHPEYDSKYWRYLDSLTVDGSSDDRNARVVRNDSTLWTATLPGGYGVVHYRIHVQSSGVPWRRAWQPFMSRTGGFVNSPDFFLYPPDFASAPSSVELALPAGWRIAGSLAKTAAPGKYAAPNAATLLDAPFLLGNLREWSFTDRGTVFHVEYFPFPDATPFDTAALVDHIRRLTRVTVDVFGHAPTREFYFLLQDKSGDALEHRGSVALGMASAELARHPMALLPELAHEFFHTWNLVAIHPDSYGELSYKPPVRTTGLWWGEGVTMYYADALLRRANLADSGTTRLDHLTRLLSSYYSLPGSTQVSPERASLAFEDSPVENPDATGEYYLQGELLGNELDALLRDSTRDARGLDDVMRALFAASEGDHGFTSAGLERVADSVCGCKLSVFANQVRGASLIDMTPLASRLGFRLMVDSIPAADSTGLLADPRLGVDFTKQSGPLRLVVRSPESMWAKGGVRTGDLLIAINGAPVANIYELSRRLPVLKVGDTAAVDIERAGRPMHLVVRVTGYLKPRVRFVEVANVTSAQRLARGRWLSGF